MRMCPRCKTRPARHQLVRNGCISFCMPCKVETRKQNAVEMSMRRSRMRAARRAALPPKPLVCPRCGINPPRYVVAGLPKQPLCAPCWDGTWVEAVHDEPDEAEDLTPAQIEQRYREALSEIRRRSA